MNIKSNPLIFSLIVTAIKEGKTIAQIQKLVPDIVPMQIYRIRKELGLVKKQMKKISDEAVKQAYKYMAEVPILIRNLTFFSKAQKKRLLSILTFESWMETQ